MFRRSRPDQRQDRSGQRQYRFRNTSKRARGARAQARSRDDRDLGRTFTTTLRSIDELEALLSADPFKDFRFFPQSKRVVTFLHAKPKVRLKLPIELDGARILCVKGTEIFSAYVRSPKGPVFMNLIEKTFGKDLTTRTWDTVGKVVKAGRK